MENKLPSRKTTRWRDGNYNTEGLFFLTLCTLNKRCILSKIVGTGVLDGPLCDDFENARVELLPCGKIADKYIKQLDAFYENISVENYVIMPNHIHLLLYVNHNVNGPSGTPVPTIQNSIVSRFVSTFKRFCNKEYGKNIRQYRSYDHIIRNYKDYEEHIKYIFENPMRWQFDRLFSEE